jgi:hypothetical protein
MIKTVQRGFIIRMLSLAQLFPMQKKRVSVHKLLYLGAEMGEEERKN